MKGECVRRREGQGVGKGTGGKKIGGDGARWKESGERE
jgi:hypothetical protein